MIDTRIHHEWASPKPSFRTGVSLHSHTLHSKESLDFIYKIAVRVPALGCFLKRGELQYERHHGHPLDLRNGWWTPPLGPAEALRVESEQIAQYGLQPLVSLTDHDDVEAPISLVAVDPARDIPVSTEWSVPFGSGFFHLGVHNLPPRDARSIMSALAAYTEKPVESSLIGILSWLNGLSGSLIVFNHPMWDEKGLGEDIHRANARRFMSTYGKYLHALEVNGLRPWHENRLTIQMASHYEKPVVSGGDRHALEPNVVLNLSNAGSFLEFSQEVREGKSDVLVTNQYRQSHNGRILRNIVETLQPFNDHGCGWHEWTDRAFYRFPDGKVLSFRQIWGDQQPGIIRAFGTALRLAGQGPFRDAVRRMSSRSLQMLD